MSQFDLGTIDPATTSGTALASRLTSWKARKTNHSGGSRPGYIAPGMN